MATEMSVRERIQVKQLIDRKLDQLYEQAAKLGTAMGELFQEGKRSQLRNLESVVAATTRTSALKNHVKNQTGKDRLRRDQNQTWARRLDGASLGEHTLKLLDELGGYAVTIVKEAGIEGSDEKELARVVEIELQRGVVQTAVCAALYGQVSS